MGVFLPLTLQRRLESSDENEIWHDYNLRNSTFNGSSLTSLTDIVTSQLTLIFDTKIWNLEIEPPCIRLASGKFELTNQDSAGGRKFTVVCPHVNIN